MTPWLAALGSVLVVSLISLAGTATLLLREEQVRRLSSRLVGFAVGGLFGDAVLQLLTIALGMSVMLALKLVECWGSSARGPAARGPYPPSTTRRASCPAHPDAEVPMEAPFILWQK